MPGALRTCCDYLRIGEALLHSFEDQWYLNPLVKSQRHSMLDSAE